MGADGAKQVRIEKGETERAVAPHGDAGDAAVLAAGANAVVALDVGDEFANEEILVADFGVAGIDVEAAASVGRDDEKFGDLLLLPEVFDHVEAAGIDQHLRIAAEAVKPVKDGIALRGLRIVRRRQDDAVGNGAAEDFAGRGAAFSTALGEGRGRKEDEENENEGGREVARSFRG